MAKKMKATNEGIQKKKAKKFDQFFTREKGFKISLPGFEVPSRNIFLLYKGRVSKSGLSGFSIPPPRDGTSNLGRPYFESLLLYKRNTFLESFGV
jgi:hypothetical protein